MIAKNSGARRVSRGWFLILLLGLLLGITVLPAEATTLIYRMEFKRVGERVNDPRARFGYLFVDSESGSVSTIVVLIDPITRDAYYTTGLLDGQYFQASPVLKRDNPVDVVTAGSGAGGEVGDFAAMQISGGGTRFFSVGRGQQVRLAPFLSGYLLLSGPDTLGETDPLTQEEFSAQFGFVGYFKAEARFQRTATRSFRTRRVERAEIISFYTEELEAIGIEGNSEEDIEGDIEEDIEEDTPDPAPSPSPLPLPTPVT